MPSGNPRRSFHARRASLLSRLAADHAALAGASVSVEADLLSLCAKCSSVLPESMRRSEIQYVARFVSRYDARIVELVRLTA
jgi:hypothetical protein